MIWDPYLHSWIVTGYAEAVTVFQEFLSARTPSVAAFERMGLPMLARAAEVMQRQMMFMDSPKHKLIRSACSSLFAAHRIRPLEQRMRALSRLLLAEVERGAIWDAHARYAEPLPAMIMTEIGGLDIDDWRQLQIWSQNFADLLGNFHQSVSEGRRQAASLEAMTRHIAERVEAQRAGERQGLIGALIDAQADFALEDEDIIANVIITLVGGLGTTANLISSGIATLLQHPAAIRQIRRDPEMMRGAIEEILRYETPSQFSGRIAPDDLILGGQQIPKGAAVMVLTAAANRDPAVFDDPDLFDITRSPNRHLAFAWGPHFCFGATLARIAAKVALSEFLALPGDVALAGDTLEWRSNLSLRGLSRLDVLTPASKPS